MQDLIERIREREASGEFTPRRGLKLVYLRKVRKDNEISQKEFAEALGIGYSTLRDYEHAVSGPVGLNNADRVARYLGLRLRHITDRKSLEEYASQAEGDGLKRNRRSPAGGGDALEEDRDLLEERITALEDQMVWVTERINDEKESPGFFRKIFS